MTLATYLTFLVACTILMIVPGPAVTLIVANSLRHGRRAGFLNIAGIQLGLAMTIGVVLLGLASLIAAMGDWFEWLRLAGAAYLIWLGWRMLRDSGETEAGTASRVPRGGFFLWASNHPEQGRDFDQTVVPAMPPELRGIGEPAIDRTLTRRALGFVADDPARFLHLCISRIGLYFSILPSAASNSLNNVARLSSFTLYLPFMLAGLLLSRSSWRAWPPRETSRRPRCIARSSWARLSCRRASRCASSSLTSIVRPVSAARRRPATKPRSGARCWLTPPATTFSASMSRPLSVSSRIASRGSSIAI